MQVAKLSSAERAKLVTLAHERAPDPTVFEDQEPFFFTARASNQTVDSYFTRMNETSLNNYAQDATDPGVQFMVSHDVMEVGFGRSLAGRVTGPKGNKECLIDFYTIPGLRAGNVSSDEFINGSRAGIYADVSIGFNPKAMICNICGNDWMRRWMDMWDDSVDSCTHWPGMEYEIEKGRKNTKVTCVLDVQDARLNEVSLVYDGATPGAGIAAVDMARMMSARGQLNPVERQALENIYRVRIAAPPGLYGGVELGDVRYSVVTKTTNNTETQRTVGAE